MGDAHDQPRGSTTRLASRALERHAGDERHTHPDYGSALFREACDSGAVNRTTLRRAAATILADALADATSRTERDRVRRAVDRALDRLLATGVEWPVRAAT